MNRKTLTSLLFAALVVLSAGTAAAATDASIDAEPSDPGATATHTVTVTVGNTSAGSWNSIAVDYAGSNASVSNVGAEDIKKIGIDRGDDESGATIDVNASNDLSSVSAANEGSYLKIGLGGSYSISAGDEVVVVYENVQNPTAEGEYGVPVDLNYQSSGGTATATLAIGQSLVDQDTATPTPSPTESSGGEATPTPTDSSGGEEATPTPEDKAAGTNGGGPGFGVVAALGAIVALAAFARRR